MGSFILPSTSEKYYSKNKSYVSLLPTNYTRSSVLLSISETYFPRRNPISISLLSINCVWKYYILLSIGKKTPFEKEKLYLSVIR